MNNYHDSSLLKRINIGYVYKINERLHPLVILSDPKNRFDILLSAMSVRTLLEELFNCSNNGDDFYGLKSSRPSADRLYTLLEKYINPSPELLKTNPQILEYKIKTIA
jgi:hypothetical protein